MRSGHVYLRGSNYSGSGNTLMVVGGHGYMWSLRGSSIRSDGITSPSGYHLSFSATNTTPSIPDERSYGFPLRCLTTVLDIIDWRKS